MREEQLIAKWNADMYDQNVTETADIDFLLSVVGPRPRKILEVACGSGRILIPLAKAGHQVAGFDMDASMLSQIEGKARGVGSISWHKADAVRDVWGTGYDLVVLAGNLLFNIVSDMEYAKAQELFVKKSADALVPGGCVYIDYQHFAQPAKVFGHHGERTIWAGTDSEGNTGKMTLLNGQYDKDSGMSTFTRRFELTLKSGERIQREVACQKHVATLEQIHQWLSDAGFEILEEYGDYNRSPINETTSRAIIYAQKQGGSSSGKRHSAC